MTKHCNYLLLEAVTLWDVSFDFFCLANYLTVTGKISQCPYNLILITKYLIQVWSSNVLSSIPLYSESNVPS